MRELLIAAILSAPPQSTDGKLEKYFAEAKFYTYSAAYQKIDSETSIVGIHDPSYNISIGKLDGSEPHGNPNREFPWFNPAMTNGIKTDKFIYNGKGIYIWNQTRKGRIGTSGIEYQDAKNFWMWEFADGTTFGEVLRFDDGTIWEVRTRTKSDGKWHPQVYRPFRTIEELEKATNMKIDRQLKPGSLTGKSIKFDGHEHFLPPIENARAIIRKQVFKPVLGFPWLEKDGKVAHGYRGGGLTPDDYRGGLLEVSRKSCMRCHDDVSKHASDLEQKRDWYGHVRGSDGIFSWHPFTEGSISYGGFWKKPELR